MSNTDRHHLCSRSSAGLAGSFDDADPDPDPGSSSLVAAGVAELLPPSASVSACAGGLSSRPLLRPPNTPLNLTLILLLLLCPAAASSATSTPSSLLFLLCSLSLLSAEIRSSADASGRERKERISRMTERRRRERSASDWRGGARWSGSTPAVDEVVECEVTGRRSTRLWWVLAFVLSWM